MRIKAHGFRCECGDLALLSKSKYPLCVRSKCAFLARFCKCERFCCGFCGLDRLAVFKVVLIESFALWGGAKYIAMN